MFDEGASDTLSSEMSELVLNQLVKKYEKLYFSDGELNAEVCVKAPAEGPACSYGNIIWIHPSVAPFTTKLCHILILHELIHIKLRRKDSDPDEAEGERFQAEVKRLWGKGAYSRLL